MSNKVILRQNVHRKGFKLNGTIVTAEPFTYFPVLEFNTSEEAFEFFARKDIQQLIDQGDITCDSHSKSSYEAFLLHSQDKANKNYDKSAKGVAKSTEQQLEVDINIEVEQIKGSSGDSVLQAMVEKNNNAKPETTVKTDGKATK